MGTGEVTHYLGKFGSGRLPGLIKDLKFVTVEGGPHNVGWTFPEVVNPALLDFVADM
jgi:pimeloyl-ACP methyl ester carboxylesterase